MERRSFLKNSALLGLGLHLGKSGFSSMVSNKRVGIIGLDTSHSVEFSKVLNTDLSNAYKGFKVVAAYPYGSQSIESSFTRIPSNIEKVKAFGVEIVDSIASLLSKVDVVLLETNDGRLHAEQATLVFQSGKRVFIDKPIGANLKDVQKIFTEAKSYGASFFSSSALRYAKNIGEIENGVFGNVLGAETFSPCTIENTHDDLYWYGIHGVEMLFAVMGSGCMTVQATHSSTTDLAVGKWADGRVGVFRGMRNGVNAFGGSVFCEKSNVTLGDYEGYGSLLTEIVRYFETGIVPVPEKQTKEIYAFMSAYQKSKNNKGKAVRLESF